MTDKDYKHIENHYPNFWKLDRPERDAIRKRYRATKRDYKNYSTKFSNCWKRDCFVPFSGNGQKICRLYELGQCKFDK
jgi:hypothetical protein